MKIYLFLDFKTTGKIFIKNTKYKKEYLLQLTFKLYDSKIEKILEEGDFYVKYSNEFLEEFKDNMTVENLITYSESGLLKKLETPLTTTTIQGIDLCLFNTIDFDINKYSESEYYSYNNIDKTVRKLNTLKMFFKNLIN